MDVKRGDQTTTIQNSAGTCRFIILNLCFAHDGCRRRHLVTRGYGAAGDMRCCMDSVRSGGRESDLTVWRVTEQLSFRVLHGTGDGAVHESSHSELRNAQFAFQHRVLDQRKTGRPGVKMNPTATRELMIKSLEFELNITRTRMSCCVCPIKHWAYLI